MKYYDENVATVVRFLENQSYGTTAICQHKRCYKLLKLYLEEHQLAFSVQNGDDWYSGFRSSLPEKSTSYKGMYLALKRLQDIYNSGSVREINISYSKPPYQCLSENLRDDLDEYVAFKRKQNFPESYLNVLRSAGARFLLFLMNRGTLSIRECRYDDIFAFFERKNQPDNAHKDRCDCIASDILEFHSANRLRLFGMSLALSKLVINQVVRDCSFMNSETNVPDIIPIEGLWQSIESFLLRMKSKRYSGTVLKSSKHVLVLLYIFRSIYDKPLDEKSIWEWLDRSKKSFGSSWKQSRRTLSQFFLFITTGELVTSETGDPHRVNSIDKLPDNLRLPLSNFLALKKREGKAKSTCDMYRSSIVRLSRFMQYKGLGSYSQITPDFLVEFNKTDYHSTPEGKQAYNSKIRRFIIHLGEEGIVNPYISEAVPTVVSRRTKIISVLTRKEINSIIHHQVCDDDAM